MAEHLNIAELTDAQVKPPRLTRIYTLSDPRTNEVRYVGKTVFPLPHRLSNHINAAMLAKRDSHVARWIRILHADGCRPVITQIDTAGDDWADRERFWIKSYRDNGARLTNLTLGGEGNLGYTPSNETRALLRGITNIQFSDPAKREHNRAASVKNWADPDFRLKCSAAISAAWESEDLRQSHREKAAAQWAVPGARERKSAERTGSKDTPETRAKKSAALSGRPCSPETRAKISASTTGRIVSADTRILQSASAKTKPAITSETRERMSAASTARACDPEYAARHGLKMKAYHARRRAAKAAAEQTLITE